MIFGTLKQGKQMARTHPNVLKARKQRREGRRAYLTSVYSLIHVPRSVGKAHVPEDAQALFAYRDRGLSVYDPWLEAIFPGVKNPQPSKERKFSLDRAEQERLLELVEHEDVCDFHTVLDSPLQQKRLTIVFNRKKTYVFLIEVDYLQKLVRRSKPYGGYDRALWDAQNRRHRIDWREELTLESLTLVLPRRE